MQNGSSSKKPTRNDRRFKKKRETMSTKTDADNKKILFEKLFFGLKIQTDAMIGMDVVRIPRSLILPISTRGIGFVTRFLVQRFARLNIQHIDFHALCASLYRISLCMLDIKLMQVLQNRVSRNLGQGFDDSCVQMEYVRSIGVLGSGFAPMLNLLSSIGVLKAYETTVLPRLPSPLYYGDFPVWDPTVVGFGSLRAYVVALSNINTPQDIRERFYNLSPIPCAIWNARPRPGASAVDGQEIPAADWPFLQNPEHIMPEEYGVAQVQIDVDNISTALDLIGRKFPEYVHNGRIEYDGPGLATQLVSNATTNLRCNDLVHLPNYTITPLVGDVDQFWSSEVMSDPEFFIGMFHLTGELPHFPDPRWSVRTSEASKSSGSGSYVAALTKMIS